MIKVALRGLAGRKLRAVLTGIAIVLGVAMISGTYVLTDTIERAFSNLFSETYAGTDVVVSGKGADIRFEGETSAIRPPVAASLLGEVRALPGVEVATGVVSDETAAKILTPEGKAVDTGGSPSFGFGIDPSPELSRFNPLNLLEGRWPTGSDEVVIDAGTADRQGYGVGDRIRVSTLKPAREFEVVGVARYGGVDTIGTATFAVFDMPTAQELLEREGQYDAISVAAREGVTPEELVQQIELILPADAQVRTADVEAEEAQDQVSEFMSFIRYFLLAFAIIALFVGSFVIFNTL
ncbi:MAG TPA: ABC transporter permease, partial [Gaiellaceae bacterium]|nr:ABC transporter permease [Gaiellaceae bacterium]